jgi:hypothetical protein
MNRRRFLAGASALGALAALPARAAAPWGDPLGEAGDHLLPAGTRAERVLELFAYGGLSPLESFCVVEEHGAPDDPDHPDTGWHAFAADHERVFSGLCGVSTDQWLQPFATDAVGMQVKLGPALWPLRQRPDLLQRLRLVVVRHDDTAHPVAIPRMLTGHRLGSPRLAGTGAHVQRYHAARSEVALPTSYSFWPSEYLPTDNLDAIDAVGAHPGSARPLAIDIDSGKRLTKLLKRGALGDRREAADRLLAFYDQQAAAQLTHPDAGRLRAPGFDDHTFATAGIAAGPQLAEVLGDDFLADVPAWACQFRQDAHELSAGVAAATHLLTSPSTGARYAAVIDAGITFAYNLDTHYGAHLEVGSTNTWALCQALVDHVNQPGEGDPDKLDLDDTMVVISTEFGRTPYQDPVSRPGATNHWPQGFVVALLGGPIRAEHAGIYGNLGPDAVAQLYVTPAELRAGLLAALGIHPFTDESFAVSDVVGAHSELEALLRLHETVLGRSS